MVTCRNCGHSSHCGVPLVKHVGVPSEFDDGHSEVEQIEICKHCRCAKCTLADW